MEFDEWEPIYDRILRDFGYDPGRDIRARDVLDGYVTRFDLERLDVSEKTVAVAGGGPNLGDELELADEADLVFAASTAADVLIEADITVDVLVTDLDKNPRTARELTEVGTPVAVHAHGDNIAAVRRHVPEFDSDQIIATTQAAPTHRVRNFGGFTDGDRAAFLADHLGAGELVFPGWDFDDGTVGPEKRRKLVWAERLLYYLQERRGESFEILDGRRTPIDPETN